MVAEAKIQSMASCKIVKLLSKKWSRSRTRSGHLQEVVAHVDSTLTKKQFRFNKKTLITEPLPFCSEDERPRSSAEAGAVKS